MTTAHTVQVPRPDGARIDGQVSGPSGAPALLLLQGQSSSHHWWTGLREGFEDRFRTITLDYRGTGATTAPPGDLTTPLFADDAVAVLDALDVDKVHVYGTSMGGRVAQMLAAHYVTRVQTLALACTSPGGIHATERNNDVRHHLATTDTAARAAAMVDLFYTPGWGNDPSRSNLFGDPTMTAANRQRHLKMSANHDAWDLLPTFRTPTLVLHGSKDRMTPVANAELIADRIPGSRLYIHPTGRHGFFDEFADDLRPVLESFWH